MALKFYSKNFRFKSRTGHPVLLLILTPCRQMQAFSFYLARTASFLLLRTSQLPRTLCNKPQNNTTNSKF